MAGWLGSFRGWPDMMAVAQSVLRSVHGASASALLAIALLAGCSKKEEFTPPPRADDAIETPPQDSVIAVPISADLSSLAARLERELPRQLWSISRDNTVCIPSRRVKVAFVRIKTPKIKCDIRGTVTRGPMTINGRGKDILVTMPLHAVVRAQDIAGILKQETASADARVNAVINITLDKQWNPQGKVNIRYGWTDAPHIDFLGQRIEFADAVDVKLKGVVSQLERTLPHELEKLQLRSQVERLWGKAFTSLQLNEKNPPVWMRITPQSLQYGGYTLNGKSLHLSLGLKARTETFVGDRPPDPEKVPLPQRAALSQKPGRLVLFVPVVADYGQLEPVIERALAKRAGQPFNVPPVGDLMVKISKVETYGSTYGRVAVGVTFSATPVSGKLGTAIGTVWLAGVPVNAENSREVTFQNVAITGDTDRRGANLLLKLANTPAFSQTIATALAQNFEKDYDDLMGKVSRAIAHKREGDLLIRATLDDVKTGQLRAAGQGVYLPVWGTGTARITVSRR